MDRITEILSTGDFTQLIGMPEDVVLEVKGTPYDLSSPPGRYELAKDVSSLANSQGGYLLLGLKTVKADDRDADIIDSLALFAEQGLSVPQYIGIIREHIYPAIGGLGVEWKVCSGSSDGIGIIHVPSQEPGLKPFIISKVVEDQQYLKQIVVGYAERTSDAGNEPLTPKRLWYTLKHGQDTHSRRLTRLEDKVNLLLERGTPLTTAQVEAAPMAPDVGSLEARVRAILEDNE